MSWLLEVTDLKQYICCPRIVFYHYCLPKVRPITPLMEEGIRCHLEEEGREERRSLHPYGLVDGERFFHQTLQSHELELSGKADLIIVIPSRALKDAEAAIVEYKYSEYKAGPHFTLQLAAYSMLIEDVWKLPVKQTFLYSIPLKRAESVPITPMLRKKVILIVKEIKEIVESEIMPPPPTSRRRCVTCEFPPLLQ